MYILTVVHQNLSGGGVVHLFYSTADDQAKNQEEERRTQKKNEGEKRRTEGKMINNNITIKNENIHSLATYVQQHY